MDTTNRPEHLPPPRPRRGRRAFLALGVVATVTLAAIVGYRLWSRDRISTEDASVDADVTPVSFEVGGPLKSVLVHDHQPVRAGDLLAEIDPADADVAVGQAEAELEAATAATEAADAQVRIVSASSSGGLSSARAQLAGSDAAVAGSRARVGSARAALTRAEAEAHRAAVALTRARALGAKGASTAVELESAEAAAASADAAVRAAAAEVEAAREQEHMARARVAEAAGRVEQTVPVDAQVAAVEAQARAARARIATAKAALAHAQLVRARTRLVAPVDGVASQVAVRAGQMVASGQIALIVVPQRTYVVARVKETDVARIQPGQPVDIDVDALPDADLHGVVESVSPATSSRFSLLQPDDGAGNFVKVVRRVPVKISWDGSPPGGVRPGMSAEVTVHVD